MSRTRYHKCITDPEVLELVENLKVLSDPNRLRIVCLLLRGERCVCEVEKELGISQQLTSHHLSVLREAGFLRARKEGTASYYTVVEDKLDRFLALLHRYFGRRDDHALDGGVTCCAPAPSTTASDAKAIPGKRGTKR